MTEEDELRAKIRELQDRVYSHKVAGRDFKAYNPYSHPQPYSPVPFRNRSLVVGAAGGGDKQSHGVIKRSPATVKWLSPEQNMAKMEGMRRHEEQLHKAEKDRIMQQGQTQNSAMYFAANAGRAPSATIPPKVITIQGTKFQVSSGGNKLLRLSDESALAAAVPREIDVFGVPFTRSKKGNLLRTSAIKPGSVNENHWLQTNEASSSLILINRLPKRQDTAKLCIRYTSTGYCPRGAQCLGIHDPHKLAICPSVLKRSHCTAGDACDLSHTRTPEITPTCTHYLLGRCTKDQCLYSHAPVDPSSAICRDFAFLGYCHRGQSCAQRHLRECPNYTNDGRCRNRNCALPHIDRASQMRKRLTTKTEGDMDVGDDPYNKNGPYDGIDSEGVDSDDLDEPPEQVCGTATAELTEQDFIGFTS